MTHEHITSDEGTGWCPESERLARENGELRELLALANKGMKAGWSPDAGLIQRIDAVLTNPGEANPRLNDGTLCSRCGKPAEGVAEINGDRYCHGDNQRPSCYERESWERTAIIGKQSVQLVNPGEEAKPVCPECKGKGEVLVYYQGIVDDEHDFEPCPTCKGSGERENP